MAPEQLMGESNFKIDIWAFGCVLFYFSTGIPPFEDINQDVAFYNVLVESGTQPLEYAESKNKADPRLEMINSNPKLREIIELCLNRVYQKRPTAEQLYQNPFFREYTTKLDVCHLKVLKNFISRAVDNQ